MQTTCPHCGRVNDMHSTTDDSAPSEGDVSLCWKCGGIALFTDNGVRLPTDEEESTLSQDEDIKQFRYAIAESITPTEAIELVKRNV